MNEKLQRWVQVEERFVTLKQEMDYLRFGEGIKMTGTLKRAGKLKNKCDTQQLVVNIKVKQKIVKQGIKANINDVIVVTHLHGIWYLRVTHVVQNVVFPRLV